MLHRQNAAPAGQRSGRHGRGKLPLPAGGVKTKTNPQTPQPAPPVLLRLQPVMGPLLFRLVLEWGGGTVRTVHIRLRASDDAFPESTSAAQSVRLSGAKAAGTGVLTALRPQTRPGASPVPAARPLPSPSR